MRHLISSGYYVCGTVEGQVYLGADVDDGAVGSGEDSGVAGLPRAPLGTVVVLPEGALRKGKG